MVSAKALLKPIRFPMWPRASSTRNIGYKKPVKNIKINFYFTEIPIRKTHHFFGSKGERLTFGRGT